MTTLVVGASGLLGSNVVTAAVQRGNRVCGTYHSRQPDFDIPLSEFDLQHPATFESILNEFEPAVVINCAAMTDVDGCEHEPAAARQINGNAPGELAACCNERDIDFVHISTDYVFDGRAREPYTEDDEPNPIQVYGEAKYAGERAVREAMGSAILARLSFIWGIHRDSSELTGFPAWIADGLANDEEIPLFTDQWITPTRAGQAAGTLFELLEHNARGIYHIAASSCITPYEFGEVVVTVAKKNGSEATLTESSRADVDRTAQRPAYSCLDVSQTESLLDRPQPTIRKDLEAVWSTHPL